MSNDPIGSVEAAFILGIDRATFNRWAAKGEVRSVFKTPGRSGMRLFSRDDVERLAKARREAGSLHAVRKPAS